MPKEKKFSRRAYVIEPEEDGKTLEVQVTITVGGEKFAILSFPEGGMVSVIAQPEEPGFSIEIVEPGDVRFTDVMTPEAIEDQKLRPWQREALMIEED